MRILSGLIVLLIVGMALPCLAQVQSYVYDFESYSFLWRDHTYASPYHRSSGGNPDSYVETHFRENVFLYPGDSPQGGTAGPLVGDLWQKYGPDFSFRVDLKVLTPGAVIDVIEYRLTGTAGEWRYCWRGPWSSADGWFTLKAPVVAGQPGLWEKFASGDFDDVVGSVTKTCILRVYSDNGPLSLAVDNWGYELGHEEPPAPPTPPARLANAVAWWRMDGLDDAVGLNSMLMPQGAAAVGFTDNSLSALGPGANDSYARFPSHTDGNLLNAQQGEHGRLKITGPCTFYARVRFDDQSITQYLFSKYDHAVGPNGSANTGAFLRSEPGGVLSYCVDDGPGGASAAWAQVSGLQADIWYDIAATFDPDNDRLAVYVIHPTNRTILLQTTQTAGFDTAGLDGAVPFTIGDRLTWNGADWVPVGNAALHADVEMAAVWSRAFTAEQLQNLEVGDIPEPFVLGFCMSTDWLKRAVCFTEMPTWAAHGINSLYVFKMISTDVIGRLDAYDFVYDIGAEYGIGAFAGMHFGMEMPAQRSVVTDYIDAHRTMPGLAAYAAPDEPVDNVDYGDFQAVCELFREKDPEHPVWCEFTSSIRWHQEWVPHVDIASSGTYAIGWGIPMWESTINAKKIAEIAADAGLEKSTFLLQCADYQGGPRPYPTLHQNRYLSYAALTVGNDGLLYYSLEYLQDPSKLDDIIYPVCDELNALKNIFASREPVPVVTSNRDTNTTGHEVYGCSISDVTYQVHVHQDKIYLIAANNTESTLSVTFNLNDLPSGVVQPVNVLFESGRTLPLTVSASQVGYLTDSFNAYDVHVYEIAIARCGDADHPYPSGDFTSDCRVNMADLAALAAAWLAEYDLSNFRDLTANWLTCTNPAGCE